MEVELPFRAMRSQSRVPFRPCSAGTITGSFGVHLNPSPLLSSRWTDMSGAHLPVCQLRWPPPRAEEQTQAKKARPKPALCAQSSPICGPCLSLGQAGGLGGCQARRWDQTQSAKLPPSAASSPRCLGGSAESSGTNRLEESLVGEKCFMFTLFMTLGGV